MTIKVVDTGIASAEKNMQVDLELLSALNTEPQSLLHFYEWEGPCATYGYFNQPSKLLKADGIAKHGLNIAKRPTGGGIIFHQFDFAFSFLLSASHPKFSLNTLDNYRFVNSRVAEVIQNVMQLEKPPELLSEDDCNCNSIPNGLFCMAKPTVYDLIIDGRKVAGAAQRRTKKGYLHQGSIALLMPPSNFLEDLLFPESGLAAAMLHSTYPLLGSTYDEIAFNISKQQLKAALIASFQKQ